VRKLNDIKVKEEAQVLDYLFENCKDLSKSKIRQLFKNKCIAVNEKVTSQFDYIVKPGDVISFRQFFKVDSKTKLSIIFEDKDFVVIDKPAGLLSVSARGEKSVTAYNMVSEYVKLRNKGNRVYVLHRLDRDTSGVLVFAKNEKLKNKMQADWNNIVTKRGYVAICEGKMKKGKAKIQSYLKENKEFMVYSTQDRTGELAITNYNVKKSGNKYSYVEVYLETGKKNQIRVHMSELGHPITGDKKYYSKTNLIKRLALHAHVLEFRHPDTLKLMTFKAEIPEAFSI
jgi:23S rRNA pseudouridine1911/1915/1917 synthase